MIRRDAGEHWLLISQVEHAYLAADLAAAWGNAQAPPLPRPALLIPAIRDHDEGWRAWEQSPQVDPERGWPREFLEMPMTQATAIWSRSIDVAWRREKEASALLARFQQFLATRSKRLTADRSLIAVAALSMRDAFDAERLIEKISSTAIDRPLSRSTVYRTLNWLEGAGLLQRDPQVRDRNIYAPPDHRAGPSPLAGLWVSLHFNFLAEKARAARHGKDAETEALDEFLETQRCRQVEWIADAPVECGDEPPEHAADVGYRWLQFFDRLSLWLCCAARTRTEQMQPPGGGMLHLTPLPSEEIAVEPYPFRTDELALSIAAKRVPVGRYDDAGLQAAWRGAPLEHLSWTFVRW